MSERMFVQVMSIDDRMGFIMLTDCYAFTLLAVLYC